MNVKNAMQIPIDDGRCKSNAEMLRKLFIDKYTKKYPDHPITPKVLRYIEKQLRKALPHSYGCSDHLPYQFMIVTALENLDEGGGSNEDAISEYIETNFTGLPWQHRSFMKNGLEKLCSNGEIVVSDDKLYKLIVGNPVPEAEHNMENKRRGRPPKKLSKSDGPQVEEIKEQLLVPSQKIEGSEGEIQGSRGGSKRVEKIEDRRKHVKVLSGENTEKLDRVEADRGHRTRAQHIRTKEQTKKQTALIRKEIEAGKHHKDATFVDAITNYQAGTSGILNSMSEVRKHGRCLHCRNPLHSLELEQLKEEVFKLKRDIQELASKIDKGETSMSTGSPNEPFIDIFDRTKLQVQEYGTNGKIIKCGDEHIQQQGTLRHQPLELQPSTFSLVVLLNLEADKQK